MNNSIQNSLKYLIPLFIVSASIILSYALIAQAQSESTVEAAAASGITFPVPDLGNCGNKDACRDYCDKPGNMDACIKFAQDHGLMNKTEASQATKFREKLAAGAGPGGCNSPESCKSFCSNTANLDACIQFADKSGFKEEKIEEAKKIQSFLKSGGKMPGGCASETSCRSYCSDFNHAEECSAFAEQAGLDIEKEAGGEKLDRGQFKKFIELAKSGQTPGGCKSKEQCESYCQSETNKEECIAFGEKMGFMDEKKAEMFRKTGGKGPGGCSSEESCKTYCNDPGNQEACFKFAEEHNLIDQGEIKNAKEGFVRLRQGLEQAPPEVASCLKSTLGTNIIEDIQAGNLTPGPQIGDRVKGCFEKFGHKSDAREGFDQAPSEVSSCAREKMGDAFEKVKSGELAPTPEMADTFRVCGEKSRLLQGPPGEEGREGDHGDREGRRDDISNFLRSAPPGIAGCLKEGLGSDFEKIQSGGAAPGQEVKEALKNCFNDFKPEKPEPREFNPADDKNHEGIKPAGIKEFKDFIKRDNSGAPGVFRPEGMKQGEDGARPGLNRETFEKFKQEESSHPQETFNPSEGFKQQFREPFNQPLQDQFQQQQFQGEPQKQPEGNQFTPPTSPTEPTPPPSGFQSPTSPPPSNVAPVPAPAPEPASTPPPTTQTERPSFLGNIFQGLRHSFGF